MLKDDNEFEGDTIYNKLSRAGKNRYKKFITIIEKGDFCACEKSPHFKDMERYFNILFNLVFKVNIIDGEKFNKLFIKYYDLFEKEYRKCDINANLVLGKKHTCDELLQKIDKEKASEEKEDKSDKIKEVKTENKDEQLPF